MTHAKHDTDDLASDIANERARVEETIESIRHRLTPGQLLDEVIRHGREPTSELVSNLGKTLSANPVPTALIGLGLLWLVVSPSLSRKDQATEPAE
jgi:hypothetical protein